MSTRYDRFLNLHTWTGVIAGMALFVAFYAGSIMVFHDSLHSWQSAGQAGHYERADAQPFMDNFLESFPGAREDFFLMLPGSGHGLSAIWLDEGYQGGQWRTVRPNEVDGPGFQAASHSGLADLVNSAHFELTIPELGFHLMGFVSLLFAVAMISGLVIHWPRIMREIFLIRHGGNTKRYWKNLHNVVGVISFPFHMIFAITGAAMGLFSLVLLMLGALAFGPDVRDAAGEARSTGPQQVSASGEAAEPLSVAALLEAAREEAPELEPTFLRLRHAGDANGVARVGGDSPGTLAPGGSVVMELATGRILDTQVAGQRDINHATLSGMYALHFATFGGTGVQLLWFLLGMAGAFLFYSGNMLWVASREKQGGRGLWLLARATPGICLGLCLALSATFVATPVLMTTGMMPVEGAEKTVFYIGWAGSFLLALVLRPPRTALYLLRATAVVTALIPLSHGWATGDFVWTKLAQGQWPLAGIDLGALCLAAGFAWLARLTRQRIQAAPAGTLWSLEADVKDSTEPMTAGGAVPMSRN